MVKRFDMGPLIMIQLSPELVNLSGGWSPRCHGFQGAKAQGDRR